MSSKLLSIEPRIEHDTPIKNWHQLIADEEFTRKFTALVDQVNDSKKDSIVRLCTSDLDFHPNETTICVIEGYEEDKVNIIIQFLFGLVTIYDGDVLKAWGNEADIKYFDDDRLHQEEYQDIITKTLKTLVNAKVKEALERTDPIVKSFDQLSALENSFHDFESTLSQRWSIRTFHQKMAVEVISMSGKLNRAIDEYSKPIVHIKTLRQHLDTFLKKKIGERSIAISIDNLPLFEKEANEYPGLDRLLSEAEKLEDKFTTLLVK